MRSRLHGRVSFGRMPRQETPRERAIEAVLSLSEMTVERGATPAEEQHALRLARRKIERWHMSIEEVAAAERRRALAQAPTVVQRQHAASEAAAGARPANWPEWAPWPPPPVPTDWTWSTGPAGQAYVTIKFG